MDREGIIIGGGAAGLTAAIAAAENGARVTILEHMPRVGKKLLSTGNGKCNLTNLKLDSSCYRCSEADFPMKVIDRFPVEDTLKFFRRLGVVTVSRNGYVYPSSGQAQTVLDALREKADSLGVKIVCDCHIKTLTKEKDCFFAQTDQGKYRAGFLILAAGSMAAKATGSDGSGFSLAKGFGHKVVKPLPALVQLRCKGDFFKSVAGVRADAGVTLVSEGRGLASDRGELQLTDYGISGIPVFQVSRYASQALDQKKAVTAVLDFYPSTDADGVFELLKEQKRWLLDRTADSFLNGIFNKKLAALFLKEAGIRNAFPVRELTGKNLSDLCRSIKEFAVLVTSVNPYEQAQVCMGGVKTSQINPKTMESSLTEGLYLAGEILDVDGICGGYNLQWAWSSGYLAGKSAAEKFAPESPAAD